MNNFDVIVKPVLTEKSYADIATKKYTFVVAMNATKIDIKKAVEANFGVKVQKVNTLIVKSKQKIRNTKHGVVVGGTSAYKKAIVQLTSDSKSIEFFDSLK
jgi:large subunit ribosomal protein L23